MKKILVLLISMFTMHAVFACNLYTVIDLGFQESDKSEAVALNDNGQVVGSYWIFGKKHFFLWDLSQGTTLIDLPETAMIAKINNAHQIIGNYTDANSQQCGFLWDPQFGFLEIRTPEGENTTVFDVNDLGQVVGEFKTKHVSLVDGGPAIHAFVWLEGSMLDLGTLSGDMGLPGDRSCAVGINNKGQIIGTSNYPIAHKGKLLRSRKRAVIWNNGNIEEIDRDASFLVNMLALSINNDGWVTYDKGGVCLLDSATKYTMSIPFAQRHSTAAKINDCGDLCLFQRNNHICETKSFHLVYLKNACIPHGNWEGYEYQNVASLFDRASGKSWKDNSFIGKGYNNNRWIVGTAENIYDEQHAVLLMPDSTVIESPKPTALLSPMIADYKGSEKLLLEKIKEAIKNGAAVNDDSRNGHRPLQLAIRQGYEEAACLLIESGADVHYQDRSLLDPIHTAVNQVNS